MGLFHSWCLYPWLLEMRWFHSWLLETSWFHSWWLHSWLFNPRLFHSWWFYYGLLNSRLFHSRWLCYGDIRVGIVWSFLMVDRITYRYFYICSYNFYLWLISTNMAKSLAYFCSLCCISLSDSLDQCSNILSELLSIAHDLF
jgi:hypothetical protein